MYGMKEPYFSACIKGRHAGKEQILYACMEKKKSLYVFVYKVNFKCNVHVWKAANLMYMHKN